MSDEEKKAIEWLKLVSIVATNKYTMKEQTYLNILSKLFEKQSKEIEDNKKYIDLHYVLYEQYTSKLNELNKKWKDKIKAKIMKIKNKAVKDGFITATEGKLNTIIELESLLPEKE